MFSYFTTLPDFRLVFLVGIVEVLTTDEGLRRKEDGEVHKWMMHELVEAYFNNRHSNSAEVLDNSFTPFRELDVVEVILKHP